MVVYIYRNTKANILKLSIIFEKLKQSRQHNKNIFFNHKFLASFLMIVKFGYKLNFLYCIIFICTSHITKNVQLREFSIFTEFTVYIKSSKLKH